MDLGERGIGSWFNILKNFKFVTTWKMLCFGVYIYRGGGGIIKMLVVNGFEIYAYEYNLVCNYWRLPGD